MKRLILLGNGFDLAHGLKTSYNDFIISYLKNAFGVAWTYIQGYDDGLLSIDRTVNFVNLYDINAVANYVDFHYEYGLDDLLHNRYVDYNGQRHHPIFKVTFKSDFWKQLLLICNDQNWVDIENEYYDKLKECLVGDDKGAELTKVNSALKEIIVLLQEYLRTIKTVELNQSYTEIFESPIYGEDVVTAQMKEEEMADDTMILNFNYTDTVEHYYEKILPVHINYIHGQLNNEANPLIFGFGDELDELYLKMELEKTKGFFTYIKSFWYFKTSNYHNLIRFIDSAQYQVFILGHSCGLSDRTMLNMIFEHENCKSIKIFYHQNAEGRHNYTDLTEEISRHFKDKGTMRKKIVPFTRSIPMPQVQPSL